MRAGQFRTDQNCQRALWRDGKVRAWHSVAVKLNWAVGYRDFLKGEMPVCGGLLEAGTLLTISFQN